MLQQSLLYQATSAGQDTIIQIDVAIQSVVHVLPIYIRAACIRRTREHAIARESPPLFACVAFHYD